MRVLYSLPALLLTVAVFAQDAETAVKALQGDWVATEAELSGMKLGEDFARSLNLSVAGERYTVKIAGKVDRGTVKLNQTKKPWAMDITGTEGPNEGKTYLAIYEAAADKLTVCYAMPGQPRPTEFRSTAADGHFLVRYQRAKK